MINYKISSINLREYDGSAVLLNGDDTIDRALPLSKKEQDYLKQRRADDPHSVVVFQRLPHLLFVVNYDADEASALGLERLRRAAAKVSERLSEEEVASIAVTGRGVVPEEVTAFVEGLTLADYSFDIFKSKKPHHIDEVVIDDAFARPDDLSRNANIWARVAQCRDWVNLPVANLNAAQFADQLQETAAKLPVTCTVFDKKKIESLRMGGLLAVNKGSVDEPRFVVLEYSPDNALNEQPVALVGKGVMYDTGGLNIKPDDYMQEMKSDMAGAATMASLLFAAADNRLPVRLTAFLPLTDSRPGFNAYAADDVLTMYDCTTVEVVNTDAEGRLILADAIAYAVANYQPELVIDAATLTGAAVRAISTFGIAAMQQNADEAFRLLKIAGSQVYERIAEFPFWPEYDEMIKSPIADLKNCGSAQAGTITAGKFLAHFAKQTPYIHLDIAGVAFFSKKQDYYAQGGSGYGLRLLYAFLQTYEIVPR